MSDDFSPYGTTEHAGREGPVTANQLVGDRVGLVIGNAVAPGVGPAMHSTAPYVPPLTKAGPRGCHAKNGTCGAPNVRGSKLCIFHQPKAKREPPAAP